MKSAVVTGEFRIAQPNEGPLNTEEIGAMIESAPNIYVSSFDGEAFSVKTPVVYAGSFNAFDFFKAYRQLVDMQDVEGYTLRKETTLGRKHTALGRVTFENPNCHVFLVSESGNEDLDELTYLIGEHSSLIDNGTHAKIRKFSSDFSSRNGLHIGEVAKTIDWNKVESDGFGDIGKMHRPTLFDYRMNMYLSALERSNRRTDECVETLKQSRIDPIKPREEEFTFSKLYDIL